MKKLDIITYPVFTRSKGIVLIPKYLSVGLRGLKQYLPENNKGRKIEIFTTLQKFRKNRSEAQNRYLWGCISWYIIPALKEKYGVIYTPTQIYRRIEQHVCGLIPQVLWSGDSSRMTISYGDGKALKQYNTLEFSIFVENNIQYWWETEQITVYPPKDENLTKDFNFNR